MMGLCIMLLRMMYQRNATDVLAVTEMGGYIFIVLILSNAFVLIKSGYLIFFHTHWECCLSSLFVMILSYSTV